MVPCGGHGMHGCTWAAGPAPTLTLTVHWGREGQSRKTWRCLFRRGQVTTRQQAAQEKVPLLFGNTQKIRHENAQIRRV